MRNLLALLGLALVVVGGLGWYLGWYKVKSEPAADPGHHNVSIDIDTNKIGKDLHNGEEKLQKMLENSKADPSRPGKEPPGKSGSMLPMPEVSGFPFDPPTPQAGTGSYLSPGVARPGTVNAPFVTTLPR